MVETLTESFCERCGTRYEFKAPTRLNPLRKTRGFIGGLKNYLTSQDALSDAMGDAMRTEEDQLAAAQLEAFHESFNFCIGCRQYTCLNCWNDAEGRCRTCAPVAGTDDLAERLAASFTQADAPAASAALADEPIMAQDDLQRRLGLDSWPSVDIGSAPAANGGADHEWPIAEPFTADVDVEPAPEPEPEPVVAYEPEPEPEPVVAEHRPLRVVAWDEDAAYEVEPEPAPLLAEVEPEPEPVAAELESAPEPVAAEVAGAPEPPVVEPEVASMPADEGAPVERTEEPIAASSEEAPEAPRAPRIAPIHETILRFPPQAVPPSPKATEQPLAAEDASPEVAARRAQLDLLGLGDPGEGPVTPERPAVIPYRSRGAAPTPIELAARGAFWDASAREVAAAAANIGVQSCGQCGLSLSANARFCRRCGTRQARSA
ncbi:MAG TPA: hypothetical protein VLA59_09905 [Patescibacteria group bacterium]|nr:hypothetical protein [Patescibacteria group bacterium]